MVVLLGIVAGIVVAAVGSPAQAAVTFANGPDVSLTVSPRLVEVGDFNNDNKADFVTASSAANSVLVRLGDGAGNFAAAPNVAVDSKPKSAAVGDFNGDANADLAVQGEANNVSVRLGDGAGNFSSAPTVTVGTGPADVAVGDFNGDGKADIATADFSANRVSVRLGDGAGNFAAAPDVGGVSQPVFVAVGDFNGDAKADLAVANSLAQAAGYFVSVLLGDGAGTFPTTTSVNVGSAPREIAVADFTGDGKADFAVANQHSGNMSVRLGDGTGSFSAAPDVTVGEVPSSPAVADFNGDTRADLAVAVSGMSPTGPTVGPPHVAVRLGDGAGNFPAGPDVDVSATPIALQATDFTGDDRPDLVTANHFSKNLSVRLNQDTTPPGPPTCDFRARPAGPPTRVVIGCSDLGSGIRQIAATAPVNVTVRIDPFARMGQFSPEVQVVITRIDQDARAQVTLSATDGDGNTVNRTQMLDPLTAPADFNGDGKTDISLYRPSNQYWYTQAGTATAHGQPGSVPVPADYTGDGKADRANFTPTGWDIQGVGFIPYGTANDVPVPGDYTGDGEADIAVWRPPNGLWFIRPSDGGTDQIVPWGTPGDIPVPADYDGNGTADIAVFRPSTGTWFLRNGPTAAWGTSGDIPVPGDYDGNGTADIAVYRPSSGFWFVRGGPTVAWGAPGGSGVCCNTDVPVSGDYDGDGDTEMAVFRNSNGIWFVRGGATVAWGTSRDIPSPLPYAIYGSF